MTYRFTTRVARTEIDPDGYFAEAALAEGEDGSGFNFMFMAGEEEPDDQEVTLGVDTHCRARDRIWLCAGSCLTGNVLRASLDPEALEDLRLTLRSRSSSKRRPKTSSCSAKSSPRCSAMDRRTLCPHV